MVVDMLYSQDLLPILFWLGIVFIIGKFLFKSTQIGLISMILVSIYFVLDFFSSHIHHMFGADSMEIGLGLYASSPYLAIFIEALFSIGALWYFLAKKPKKVLSELLIATRSFREILSISAFDLGFNTNMPTLIFTYGAMLYCLNYLVPKFDVKK